MKTYYVYILASRKNGTLYVGMTNDLLRRVQDHKQEKIGGFTKEYGVKTLVHFEMTNDVCVAIQREKRLKKWNRSWKIALIEKANPSWKDLYLELIGVSGSSGHPVIRQGRNRRMTDERPRMTDERPRIQKIKNTPVFTGACRCG